MTLQILLNYKQIMNHPPNPHNLYYKTIKTSLKSITVNPYVLDRLNATVLIAHRITIHTLQFLKLYILHSLKMHNRLPLIDHSLISNIMKTIAPKQTRKGRPPKHETIKLKEDLQSFYLEHYQGLMVLEEPPLSYEHMNTLLEYMAITIETSYLNNVKQHFVTCVERYINLFFHKQTEVNKIKSNTALSSSEKKDQVSQLSRFLRDLKTDILDLTKSQLSSDLKYHSFVLQVRNAILPQKGSYEHNSVYYDLEAHPEQYLLGMFRMIKEMETHDVSIMNLFPLRTGIVPKYIKIDTTTLVHLLINPEDHGYTKGFCTTKGRLIELKDKIWGLFFKTQMKCFYNKENHKYRFNYMIETDGVGCSIQLIRRDLFGRTHIRQVTHCETQEKYVNEIPIETLQNKKLVAIDPNLSDLLYCTTKDGDRVIKLRYTQNQRRKETKSKKYMRLIEQFKANTQIGGQTLTQWESQLSQHNHKTLVWEQFQDYVRHKNRINNQVLAFYENYIYRKLRLNGYINRQKSEARFLNRFKRIFGSSDQVVIGIGDYEQYQHRKFKEPVKGKGFRGMFRRFGYRNICLVDEHRTSRRCHNCKDVVDGNRAVGGECVTFRKCQNPRPWRREEQIVRHGLLMCQTCQKLWCRDTNASLNIWEIMRAAQEARQRPTYLQRGKISISGATSAAESSCSAFPPIKLNIR